MKKFLHLVVACLLLGSITITVEAQTDGFYNKTFTFTIPTQNTDNSPLLPEDIKEFRFYCNGGQVGTLTQVQDTWTSPDGIFPPGDYDCVATTVNIRDVESGDSNHVNFTVPGSTPKAIIDFTVILAP